MLAFGFKRYKKGKYMKKDRFIAFFDAVMAIIMTIGVLEFVIPSGAGWKDLDVFWFQLIAYAISFFWLSTMWINLHSIWNHVERVTRGILFINMFTLFFSSMIPFLTVYLGRNLLEQVPQILYGTDVILIIICNFISNELLAKYNPELKKRIVKLRVAVVIDESIKILGVIVGTFGFPPAILISVFFSAIFLAIVFGIHKKRKQKAVAEKE